MKFFQVAIQGTLVGKYLVLALPKVAYGLRIYHFDRLACLLVSDSIKFERNWFCENLHSELIFFAAFIWSKFYFFLF